MADGRMLRRTIATNEQLAAVSLEAALVFTWCLPFLDVEGRMYGSPLRVKALVFPMRDEISATVIERSLSELYAVGLVIWYGVGGEKCLAFPGFLRNNTVRPKKEAKSKVPPPPASAAASGPRPDYEETGPGVLPEHDGRTPAERKLSEVKRNEVKTSTPARKQPRAPGASGTSTFNAAPLIDAHRDRFDADPPAKDLAALKRLVTKHGHDETLVRWKRFLAEKGQFGAQHFEKTWGDWGDTAAAGRAGARTSRAADAERLYELLTMHGLLTASKDVFTAEVARLHGTGDIRDPAEFMAIMDRIDLHHLGTINVRHFAITYLAERLPAKPERRAAS